MAAFLVDALEVIEIEERQAERLSRRHGGQPCAELFIPGAAIGNARQGISEREVVKGLVRMRGLATLAP